MAVRGEPYSTVTLPPPSAFPKADTVSVSVVRVNSDHKGRTRFLTSCYSEVVKEMRMKIDPLLVLVYLSLRDQDPIARFLPIQGVRTDRWEKSVVQPSANIALHGYRGLQSRFYRNILRGPDGVPFPLRRLDGGEVALAPGWDQPGRARVLTRHQGIFYLAGSLREAAQIFEAPEPAAREQFQDFDHQESGIWGKLELTGLNLEQRRAFIESNPILTHLRESQHLEGLDSVTWSGVLMPDGRSFRVSVMPEGPQSKDVLQGIKDVESSDQAFTISISTRQVARFFLQVEAP